MFYLLPLLSGLLNRDEELLTWSQTALKPSTLLGRNPGVVRWWCAARQMGRGLVHFLRLEEARGNGAPRLILICRWTTTEADATEGSRLPAAYSHNTSRRKNVVTFLMGGMSD